MDDKLINLPTNSCRLGSAATTSIQYEPGLLLNTLFPKTEHTFPSHHKEKSIVPSSLSDLRIRQNHQPAPLAP